MNNDTSNFIIKFQMQQLLIKTFSYLINLYCIRINSKVSIKFSIKEIIRFIKLKYEKFSTPKILQEINLHVFENKIFMWCFS